MTLTLTLLVDCAGTPGGGRTAAANAGVKMFVAALPADVSIRILRYSDTAMWHLGPEPVPAGEIEWRDLLAGGYLSSVAHAVNLAGPTLSAPSAGREVALLISDGAMSDPAELLEMVLARRFSGSVIRAAASLTPAADRFVLGMFAGDRVFDSGIFSDPRPFLASFGEEPRGLSVPAAVSLTLCCSLDLGSGDSVSLSVSGVDMVQVKQRMRDALMQLGRGDEGVQNKIAEYLRRLL